MEYHSLIEMHKGIIYLFLAFYVFKVVLMFVKQDLFDKVRNKTKIVEMILGPLIIATGIWLLTKYGEVYNSGIPTWLIVKIVLVTLGIALAIIGLKRGNKALAVVALLLFIYSFMTATFKSLSLSAQVERDTQELVTNPPIQLVSVDCATIHGPSPKVENPRSCAFEAHLVKRTLKGL